MRSLLLSVTLLAGCASEASWTLRDASGWPVPTWSRMGSYPERSFSCGGVGHTALTSPDALGPKGDRLAVACGYHNPGWRAREEQRLNAELMRQQRRR